MKILIDINHPAHVHLFKHFTWEMMKKGHSIVFTAMDKEISIDLLRHYKFKYYVLGKHRKKPLNKILELFKYNLNLAQVVYNFKPDIFVSHGSIYAAQIAFLFRKNHFAFEDTENATINNFLCHLFTKNVITSNSYKKELSEKQIRYEGYLELAYLHPHYFSPDPSILDILGVDEGEKYVIIRFVSWEASHDINHKGIYIKNKINAVKEFSKYATVFISSEGPLPNNLKKYRINIQPEKMHDVLYYATLLYSEGATMVSESAVLGTPAIFINNIWSGLTDEQEKRYGLVFHFNESLQHQEISIKKGIELLQASNLKREWQKRRQKMLSEKINVTDFMVWFISNYPQSYKIMKKDPDYQMRFK